MASHLKSDLDKPLSTELREIRDLWHVKNHPLFQDWRHGKLELIHMGVYMAQHQEHVRSVLKHYPIILTKAPADARHFALDNLAEEAGIVGGGMGERDAVDHQELIYRFTRYCGLTDDEANNIEVLPAWRSRSNYCIRTLYEQPAEIYMAGISISESQEVGQNRECTVPGFIEHYGFEESAIEIGFFTEHALADEDHGRRQVEMAEQYVTTQEMRDHALNVAWTFGELKWGAIDQLYNRIVLGEPPRLPEGIDAFAA